VFIACLLSFMTLIAPIASVASASPNYRATSAKTSPAPSNPSGTAATASESLDAQEAALFLPAQNAASSVNSHFASASAVVNAISLFDPAAGDVTATMADSQVAVVDDLNSDGNADPGEKISYSVLLNNPAIGSDASGLSFNVPLDSHTTLVPGSIQSTPVTFDKVVPAFNEDAPAQPIVLQGQDPDGTNLTFAIVTGPTKGTLGSIGSPACNAAGVCSATVNYTPTANEFGTDSFTFKVNDGTADSNQVGNVSITINSVNDAPSFTSPGNPSAVNEDVAGQTVASFVTGISKGPANESGQTVDFIIDTNSHPALFAVAPAISAAGTLTYTPAANANGVANITFHIHDDGGTANGGVNASSPPQPFTITVNAVNDAPVAAAKAFTVQANMKISGLTGLLAGVTDADAVNGAADPLSADAIAGYTAVNVTLTSLTLNTCTNGTATITNAATGTFNFDPPPGLSIGNTCVLNFRVTDTGNPAPGVQSAAQNITITAQGPAIWFVDPARATDGNGTLSDTSAAVGPFNKISSANAKLASLASTQRVFVYTGNTPIGATEVLTLQGGTTQTLAHWLIGQGAVGADFDTFFGINGTVPAGTIARPSINGTRPTVRGTVTMKDNTVVNGVNIDVSGAAAGSKGLTGTGLGAGSVISIKDVNVTSTTGNAVDFSTAQTLTYTTSNSVTSPNIISSGTGTALRVVTTTIGAGGMTFKSISANGAPNGIVLDGTGAGFLTVTGDGSQTSGLYDRDGSGGIINAPTGHAVSLTNANNVTLRQMNITNTSAGGACQAACTSNGIRSSGGGNIVVSAMLLQNLGGNGWYGTNITGTNSFDNNGRIENWQAANGFGIYIDNTNTNFTSFTVDDSTFTTSSTGSDGFLFDANGTTTGVITVRDSLFTLIDQDGVQVNNDGSGTIAAIIQNNDFLTADSVAGDGNNTLFLANAGSGRLNFTIGGPNAADGNVFTDIARLTTAAGVIQVNAVTTGQTGTELNGTIQNNTITNSTGRRGIMIGTEASGGAHGTHRVAILNNTINNLVGQGINFTLNSVGGGHSLNQNYTIDGNNIGTTTPVGTLNGDGGSAIEFDTNHAVFTDGGDLLVNMLIQNNNFVNNNPSGVGDTLDFANRGGDAGTNSTFNLTILSNNFTQQNAAGHVVDILSSGGGTGAGGVLNLDMNSANTNPNNTTLAASAAGEIQIRQTAGTFNIENLGANPATTFVSTRNNGDAVTVSGTVGSTGAVTLPAAPVAFLMEGASAGVSGSSSSADSVAPNSLTSDQLELVVEAAINRWSASGLTSQQIATLRQIKFDVADLEGSYLGEASDSQILIDRNAGGKGWYADETPLDDSDFAKVVTETRRLTAPTSAFANQLDLLTAIMHEMGHKLRLGDAYADSDRDSLMYGYLTVGERRLPASGQAKVAQLTAVASSHFLSLASGKKAVSAPSAYLNAPSALDVPRLASADRLTVSRTFNAFAGVRGVEDNSNRKDIRLNHASRRTTARTDNSATENNGVAQSAANAVAMQPVMFAGGTFPINGTAPATGFTLPAGKSTTITFKVTVNNPPNFAGPTSNQVSQQGALTGLILTPSTVLTDDQPGTAAPNEPTLTTVDLFNTTTTLSALPAAGSWNAGQPITFTAAVASNPSGNPTALAGSVTFYDGAILPGNIISGCNGVAVSSGQAQCVKAFTTGAHTITAVYSGDGNFDPSTSNSLSQTVNKSNTTTAVTLSSLNPSKVTQNVTFTATVTSASAFSGPPTGTLTFKDGATTICNLVVMSAGQAQCSISNLTAGPHNINVFYSGDSNFNSSDNTASPFVQTVNKSDTTTTLGSSLNPSLVSQSVTFTATVASSGVAFDSTGTVTFKNGGVDIGTCTNVSISGGQAVCTLSNLTATTHNITAVYNGNATFNASPVSNTVAQVVNKSNTSTALVSSKNPASPADTVTFTATVTSSGVTFTNTGTVAFYDGAILVGNIITGCGTKTLNGSGQATCAVSGLTEGTHNITAVYSGDATFNTSNSNVVAQVISKTTPTVVVTSSVNPSSASQSVTFTAKVTSSNTAEFPGPPSGTIQFKDGATNIGSTVTLTAGACPGGTPAETVCAVQSTSTLTAGTHVITADYVGDGTANGSATFNNSTGTLPGGQVVNKTNTSTAVTSGGPNPSRVTESVTFTATVTFTNPAIVGPPTGNVTFKYGGVTIVGCSAQALNGSAVATCVTSTVPADALPAGSHTITAEYNGDANFNTSTGSFTGNPQVVNKSATTTTLVSSMNPSPVPLDPVTFTATVTFAPGVTGPPTGTVTFKDGANPIPTCTAQPVNGSAEATCTVVLTQGTHSITAVYNGDSTFNASPPSNTVSQVIGTCSASVVVTSNGDAGPGTLRQALIDVCDPGTITFDPGVTLITLTTAQLALDKNLTITGPGANVLAVERSSAALTPDFRIFNLISGKTVTISGMTITNGNVVGANGPAGLAGNPENGGGIFNDGTLTLLNVILSNNHARGGNGGNTTAALGANGGPAHGGGIFSSGTLTLTNTTVSGNTAIGGNGGTTDGAFANGNGGEGFGAGVYNNGTLPATIENSTISGNTATGGTPGTGGTGGAGVAGSGSGGGIYTGTVAALVITNSTISGNRATNDGGGIYNLGGPSSTTLTSVTVTNNYADEDNNTTGVGGGIYQVTGALILKNTIVAANFNEDGVTDAADDIAGAVFGTSSFNLIGADTGMTGIANLTQNNQVGTGAAPINPLLGALGPNGGPTQTHALQALSPALEKGNAFSLTTDQRGFQRPVDFDATVQGPPYDESDIGAFELQLAFPTIAKAFGPTTIQAGSMSNITLTLSNTNTSALTGASFTDTLASNLVAVGGTVGGTCTGADSNTLTVNQAGLLSFSGITIPASGSCTVIFAVTSGTPGSYPNSTSGVTTTQTTTAGPVSNTDTLIVRAAPTIAKGFAPTAIASGGTSTVTLTLSNSNAIPLTSASFTDTLVNMSAVGGAVTTTCGGTPLPATLNPGDTALSFSGITIPAGGSCTVAFSVTSSTPGINPNSTSGVATAETTIPGTGSNIANLAVTGTPSIVKGFSPTSIQSGGNSTVTLTLNNGNAFALTNASFTDTLVNMSAVGGAVGGTCIGTAPNALVANATALSFSGITIPAGGSCTVTFAIKSSTVGTNPNSTSGITTNETATGAASNTANLTVFGAPAIGKSFGPTTIQSGGTSTVTLTLTNGNAAALNNASFTDTLANMSAVGGAAAGSCSGANTNILGAGATALSFSGITIPASGNCTVTFAVTSSTVGTNPNATSGVTTTETPTAGAVSNTVSLTVLGAPTIAKAFGPTAIQSGGTSTVTLTLSNGNASALTNASFTDTLANMSAVGGAAAGTCSGANTNILGAGATALSFSGITIPASGNCTVTFAVTSSTVGTNPNATSGVTTTETPTAGAVSNTANLTVLGSPTIAKAFGPNAIQSGDTSTVTLTLTNGNASALTNASFTDTLANMTAVGGAAAGSCVGANTNVLGAGATALSFSGITIPASGNCTVTFAVTSSNVGTNPNATSGVTTTETPVVGTGSNSADLTVYAAPTIAKAFSPTAIQTGGTSTVTLTLTNTNTTALTNASFTDTLVNMSAVGGTVGGDCAGANTNSLVANATALSFSGITIPANSVTCTVTFDVKSSTPGTNPNSTSGVTTTQTATPGTVSNTANLSVFAPPTVLSILRADPSPTNLSTVNFTVTFSKPVTGVDPTDFTVTTSGGITLLPNPVTNVTPAGPSNTYTVTVNTGTGDGSLRLDLVDDDSIVSTEALVLPLGGTGAGNGNFSAGEVYTISKTDPVVSSITHADPNPTNAATVNFTVIFSKPVTGVNIGVNSDFALATTGTIAGASITGLSGSGTTYTVTVGTGTGNGTIRLDVLDDDSIVDSGSRPLGGVGAGNGATTGLADTVIIPYTIDRTPPTVALTIPLSQANPVSGPTATTVIHFTATFDEAVTGFDPSDVLITGTSGASLVGITEVAPLNGTTYDVAISGMTQSGNVMIQVKAGGANDLAGNPNTLSAVSAPVVYNKDDFTGLEVNTTLDTDDLACAPLGTGNGCTLREAINAANADFGDETITFNIPTSDPGFNVGTGVYTINLTGVLPDLSSSMTISGLGAKVLTVRRNTGGNYRIFNITAAVNNVTIDGLTISNGNAAGASPLDLGGGIFNASTGTVNITNSTISGNAALAGGGGIAHATNAGLNITNSTISGNSSLQAGGVQIIGLGAVNITNSTISGNNADTNAGGVLSVNATTTITNSTITNNRADNDTNGTGTGGGIASNTGTVTLRNTIVAANFNDASPSTTADDIAGTVAAASSFNLIGTGGAGGLVNATNQNQVGVVDPGLFPLLDNGGNTMTHALTCTSVAIDKGFKFTLTSDQRGGSRPFDLADAVYPNATGGDGSDIGAYEVQSGGGCLPLAIAPTPAPTTNEDTPVVITLTGTYAQNTPLTFTITQQPGHSAALVPSAPNCVFTTSMTCTSTVTYSPAANYFGPDLFKFRVSAGSGPGALNSDPVDVNVTVNPINDLPVAIGDPSAITNEDQPLPLLLNGSDIDGGPLTFIIVSNPAHGSLSAVSGQNVTYTPNPNYFGPDSFTFKINDTFGDSNTATISINVISVNDSPTAVNDVLPNIPKNSAPRLILVTTLMVNDLKGPADENGQTLTVTEVFNIEGGTVALVNGDVVFTPTPNYVGPAIFSYTVQDNGTTNGSPDPKTSLPGVVQFNITEADAPPQPLIRFSSNTYSVAEGAGFRTITVERSGDTTQAVTVDYASSDHSTPADFVPCTSPGDGFASSRCDFTTAIGTLRFGAGDTSKTFNVLITNDNYVEGTETLQLTLSNPTNGAVFGVPQTATLSITDDASEPATNPIGNSADFVRAQYHDILAREPDAAGLAFWTDNIEKCNDPSRIPAGQTVPQCIDKQRESTAIAFFESPEFKMTGGFVYHLYKGSLTGSPNYDGGSAGRFPTFLEFMHDMSQVSEGIVVNGQISGAVVEANRNALAAAFVARPEFVAKYGGLNNTNYVQELFNTTGIAATAAEKQALVDALTGGESRASVLRKVVDGTVVISEGNVQSTTTYGQAFINQENRRLFVYLEYIGYMRRNPDTAGFVFWLGKLNFYNGDPFQAEMVRSFILSPEYRSRFGQP
jgi:CSLREA domain-containing protein